MKNKLVPYIFAGVLVLAMIAGSFLPHADFAYSAPAIAPTPLSSTIIAGPGLPQVVTWFNGQTITADTTSPCIDLSRYSTADIYYNIDQTATNTTTLTLKFGNTSAAQVSGVNVVATNTADAAALQPFQLFGACTAILADVANSTPVAITVNARVK